MNIELTSLKQYSHINIIDGFPPICMIDGCNHIAVQTVHYSIPVESGKLILKTELCSKHFAKQVQMDYDSDIT